MKHQFKLVGMTFSVREFPQLKTENPFGTVDFVRNTQHDKPDFPPEWRGIMAMDGDVRIGWVANKSEEQALINKHLDEAGDDPVYGTILECDYSGSKPWCSVEFEDGVKSTKEPETKKDDSDFEFYEKDGKQYQRITNVLGRVEVEEDTSGLDDWKLKTFNSFREYAAYMKQAADRGTVMHAVLEHACKLGVIGATDRNAVVDAIPEGEFSKIPKGFWIFVGSDCKDMKILAVEETVFDDENLVAGTFDLLVEQDGKLIVIDWKSSKQVYPKQLVQAGWYAAIRGADEAWVVAWGSKNSCGYQIKKVKAPAAILLAREIISSAARVVSGSKKFFAELKG